MSDATNLLQNGATGDDGDGMNMLAGTTRAASIPPIEGALPPIGRARTVQARHVAQALAGHTQEQVIEKRDNAGKEAAYLARVMNNPNVTRSDVAAYLGSLAESGQISNDELVGILRTLPHQSQQIRQWAQMMFAVMMHVGVHGHAAYPQELFPGGAQPPDAQPAGPQDAPEAPDEDQGGDAQGNAEAQQ